MSSFICLDLNGSANGTPFAFSYGQPTSQPHGQPHPPNRQLEKGTRITATVLKNTKSHPKPELSCWVKILTKLQEETKTEVEDFLKFFVGTHRVPEYKQWLATNPDIYSSTHIFNRIWYFEAYLLYNQSKTTSGSDQMIRYDKLISRTIQCRNKRCGRTHTFKIHMGLAVQIYLGIVKEAEWAAIWQTGDKQLSHLADVRGDANPLSYRYENKSTNIGRQGCCKYAASQKDSTKKKCSKHMPVPCNWSSFRQQDDWAEVIKRMVEFKRNNPDRGALEVYELMGYTADSVNTVSATLEEAANVGIQDNDEDEEDNEDGQDDEDDKDNEDHDEDDDGFFEVKSILDSRMNSRMLEYYVWWEGYTLAESTWQPWTDLRRSPEAVKAFHRSNKGRGKSGPPRSWREVHIS